jgi:hypothetical protein
MGEWLNSSSILLHPLTKSIINLKSNIMKTYNGHRSWNAWNVSLWINNDENTYRQAIELLKTKSLKWAIINFCKMHDKTPDGAKYTHLSVKLALTELKESIQD